MICKVKPTVLISVPPPCVPLWQSRKQAMCKAMLLIYWSGTGNTEAMADLIKEGAESLILNEAPEGQECKDFGAEIAG
jgi:Flavodoxins